MQDKLINIETKETHLCDRLSIGGFDYFVDSSRLAEPNEKFINESICPKEYLFKPLIATTNPSIDCPKVVDEVEKLAKEHCEYWEFDRLLGSGSNGLAHDSFVFGHNKAKETYTFSKEDMIDFLKFYKSYILMLKENGWEEVESSEDRILEVWKSQQPKTIYFKN